jgi:hypothetical protein
MERRLATRAAGECRQRLAEWAGDTEQGRYDDQLIGTCG